MFPPVIGPQLNNIIDGGLQNIGIVLIPGPALELHARIGEYFGRHRGVVLDTLVCGHTQAAKHDSIESA